MTNDDELPEPDLLGVTDKFPRLPKQAEFYLDDDTEWTLFEGA